jgi:hypothetical protein
MSNDPVDVPKIDGQRILYVCGVCTLVGIAGILLSKEIISCGRKIFYYADQHINDPQKKKVLLRLLQIGAVCLAVIGLVAGVFASFMVGLAAALFIPYRISPLTFDPEKPQMESFFIVCWIGIFCVFKSLYT